MTAVRDLAIQQFGKPTSESKTEMRFGRKGSVSVDLREGLWIDFETGQGGKLRQDDGRPPPRKTREEIEREEQERARHREEKRQKALAFWRACEPAAGTIVETYLRSRGLFLPSSPSVRFHPGSWNHITNSTWPVMVWLIREIATGRPIGAHRTFLRPDGRGKAPIWPSRLTMGLKDGGAIMIHRPEGPWHGVGEGIETALSGHLICGLPCWALIDSGEVGKFRGGPGTDRALLFADRDKAGYAAAQKMVAGYPGTARAVAPLIVGHDWNDEVKRLRVVHAAYTGTDLFVPGSVPYVDVTAK